MSEINQVRQILMNELGLTREYIRGMVEDIVHVAVEKKVEALRDNGTLERWMKQCVESKIVHGSYGTKCVEDGIRKAAGDHALTVFRQMYSIVELKAERDEISLRRQETVAMCEQLQQENAELRIEIKSYLKVQEWMKNGMQMFNNPCEHHSGDKCPPLAEFTEKYGYRCTMCDADSVGTLTQANAELAARVEALERENETLKALFPREKTISIATSSENPKTE